MDKNTIIILVVVAALLIGIPLLGQLRQSGPAPEAKVEQAPVKLEPPYWNSTNLAGTRWTGKFKGISAVLDVQPGGTAVLSSSDAMVKMMVPSGMISATWRIDGSRITIEADVPKLGKQKIAGTISGKQFVDDKGVALPLTQVQ